jgi:ACS family glucarate transporter-like MFS transporter
MNDNPYESPRTNDADRLVDIPQALPLIRLRYFVLAMLVLLSVVTYLDRICIGVAAADIQHDLGISDEGWGWVLGAFLLAYGLFEIPSGALGDRIGQRKVLTRIVLWWSAFTALTPLARNFYAMVATRFLFGAGEAGAYPNASGCISRWFPTGERARAQGLVWGASRLGGALAPLIVVPLNENIGWESCFWLFGVLGLAWAAVWMIWFRDNPAEHPAMSAGELKEIGHSATAGQGAAPWGKLFSQPQLWLIVGMYWFYVFGFIFFMFWMPKFLTQGRGMSQSEMGWTVGLMFSAGAVGNLIGGWLSDGLSKRYGLAIGRKVIGVTCLAACGLLMIMAALTPGKFVAAGLLIAAFGIADAMLPCSWAICLDVGRHYSGAVSGAMNSAGQAAGYICTVLFGYLIKFYGYDRPLLFLAPNLLIAAVLFALIDPTRPLVDEPTESDSAE